MWGMDRSRLIWSLGAQNLSSMVTWVKGIGVKKRRPWDSSVFAAPLPEPVEADNVLFSKIVTPYVIEFVRNCYIVCQISSSCVVVVLAARRPLKRLLRTYQNLSDSV